MYIILSIRLLIFIGVHFITLDCSEYKLKLSREHLFPNFHLMVLSSIRRQKFKYYDLSNDRKLQHSELLSLHNEIYYLIATESFQVQLKQLLDSDSNNSISKQEWNNYFTRYLKLNFIAQIIILNQLNYYFIFYYFYRNHFRLEKRHILRRLVHNNSVTQSF